MKNATICALALGCASLVGVAQAQTPTNQDKQFLQTASQGNFDEIQFSKLALHKSQNPTVRAFANRMVQDHTKLGQEMQPFAQAWGITPASTLDSEHQQKYDQLQGLSGADFDKQYMSDMTTDHTTTLQLFQSEEASTRLPKFKATVRKGEHVVAEHLSIAKRDDAKLGVPANG